MSAKERKCKSAKERKIAQKSAKERFHVKIAKTRFETTRVWNSQDSEPHLWGQLFGLGIHQFCVALATQAQNMLRLQGCDSESANRCDFFGPVRLLWLWHCSGESNRPLTPTLLKSIAIHLPFLSRYLCKSMASFGQKVVYTPPICITIRLPLASRHFCRSIGVKGR